jgi:hypothetical protein
MIIRPSSSQFVAIVEKLGSEYLGIGEGLLSIGKKRRSLSFFECDCDSSDRIHMRSALHSRKNRSIYSGRNIFDGIFRFFERIGNSSFGE